MSDGYAPEILSDARTDFVESSKTGWEHSKSHAPMSRQDGRNAGTVGEGTSAPIKSRGTSGRSRTQGRKAGMQGTSPSAPKRRRNPSERSRPQVLNRGTTLYGNGGRIVSSPKPLKLDATTVLQRDNGSNRTVRKPRPSGRRFVGIILSAALAAFCIGGVKRAVDEFNAPPEFEVGILTPTENSDGRVPILDQNGNFLYFAPEGSIATIIDETDGHLVKVKFADDKGNNYVGYVGDDFLDNRQVVNKDPEELDVKVNEDEKYVLASPADKNGKVEVWEINGDGEITKTTTNESELSDPPESNPLVEEIMKKTQVNAGEKVVGIDVAFASGDELEEILKNPNAIPKSAIGNTSSSVNKSNLSGRVNYVMIQIGYSGLIEEFNTNPNNNYNDCVDVCEKNGIPYGLYYFSTARDEEEAKKEIEIILDLLAQLGTKQYNLLPIAIDREQGGRISSDTTSIEDYTKVTAKLLEGLEKECGSEVLLYTGNQDISGANQILNLDSLKQSLKVPLLLWGPLDGTQLSNLVMQQEALDFELPGGTNVDINTIDAGTFCRLLNREQNTAHDTKALTKSTLDEGPDGR